MSAFMCSPTHILTVARGIASDPTNHSEIHGIAKILFAENERSVRYRYNDPSDMLYDTDDVLGLYFRAELNRTPEVTERQLVKLIACLDYQSCECRDYSETPAAKYMNEWLNANGYGGEDNPAYNGAVRNDGLAWSI